MLTKAEREDMREFFIALYKQGGITDARYSQLRALLDDLDAKDEALAAIGEAQHSSAGHDQIPDERTVSWSTCPLESCCEIRLAFGDSCKNPMTHRHRRAAEAGGGE